MKLRKCFCGGNSIMYPFDNSGAYSDEHRKVYCKKCGFGTPSYWNGNFAASRWNFLIRKKLKENN